MQEKKSKKSRYVEKIKLMKNFALLNGIQKVVGSTPISSTLFPSYYQPFFRLGQKMLGHARLESPLIHTRVAVKKLKDVPSATHPGVRLERHQSGGLF